MAIHMTAQEARDDFAETLNRVAYGSARVVVQRRGKPVAAIVSVEDLYTLEAMAAREDAEDLTLRASSRAGRERTPSQDPARPGTCAVDR